MWSWSTVFVGFVICVLPLSIAAPVKTNAQYFECGQDICKNKGYDICIAPPLVSEDIDSYCMPCEEFKKSCGTSGEEIGCNLYCQDLLTNSLDRRVKELEAENAKLREKYCGNAFTGLWWFIACVSVTVLFFLAITYFVYQRIKHNRKKKMNEHIDNLSSSSDCSDTTPLSDGTADGEEKEEEEHECNTTKKCYGAEKLHNINPTQTETGEIAI